MIWRHHALSFERRVLMQSAVTTSSLLTRRTFIWPFGSMNDTASSTLPNHCTVSACALIMRPEVSIGTGIVWLEALLGEAWSLMQARHPGGKSPLAGLVSLLWRSREIPLESRLRKKAQCALWVSVRHWPLNRKAPLTLPRSYLIHSEPRLPKP